MSNSSPRRSSLRQRIDRATATFRRVSAPLVTDAAEPRTSGERTGPLAAVLGMMAPPLDLRILGRTLLHTALVGLSAGLIGAAFFAGLEYMNALLLERVAGYTALRAHGEKIVAEHTSLIFRPVVLMIIPCLGALAAGLICRLAPETRGGGGDAMIRAFHQQGGAVRPRVIWVKALASIFTLGSGGSGGREGPAMHIGSALGSTIGALLGVSARERRILMVAGVAAGMTAVFRTPLGAAILAAEVLYRDDFEAEALVPAVLASVIAYSVVIAIFGESRMFARAEHYQVFTRHLPLYALLAVLVAALASTFIAALRGIEKLSRRLPGPEWARPAVGGFALSLVAVPLMLVVGERMGTPGRSLGIFGSGYGIAQVAITGANWLPVGWHGIEFLAFLCLAKLVATSLTIGTGASAGDFGPALVLGGLFGGAFGRAAALILHDPSIDPGAFALVGMGTFYGGIAHVPVSSLIMVCEMAGSYDLLVPLMLAGGIAFVTMRKRFLYEAQPSTHDDSPVHRRPSGFEILAQSRVAELMLPHPAPASFSPGTTFSQMARFLGNTTWQVTFPVNDETGAMVGVVTADAIEALSAEPTMHALAVAADLMQPLVALRPLDSLRRAAELFLAAGVRQLPVVGADDRTVGFLDESDVTRSYLESLAKTLERPASSTFPVTESGGMSDD